MINNKTLLIDAICGTEPSWDMFQSKKYGKYINIDANGWGIQGMNWKRNVLTGLNVGELNQLYDLICKEREGKK